MGAPRVSATCDRVELQSVNLCSRPSPPLTVDRLFAAFAPLWASAMSRPEGYEQLPAGEPGQLLHLEQGRRRLSPAARAPAEVIRLSHHRTTEAPQPTCLLASSSCRVRPRRVQPAPAAHFHSARRRRRANTHRSPPASCGRWPGRGTRGGRARAPAAAAVCGAVRHGADAAGAAAQRCGGVGPSGCAHERVAGLRDRHALALGYHSQVSWGWSGVRVLACWLDCCVCAQWEGCGSRECTHVACAPAPGCAPSQLQPATPASHPVPRAAPLPSPDPSARW